jgi:type I restriction enzyme S subunit
MKQAVIRSSWMEGYGYRLDCQPYLGGALETKIILERVPVTKEPLSDVTKAIYHAGRETRHYVDSPEYGIPFLRGGDILKADLSNLALISKQQVADTPAFTIRQGYILITRSGTIGRMTYARREMDGMACSEDLLRVVADERKIRPGYLYAFLSSKFGVPLVASGTYGAIIQHLKPHHIADLPVPRLGKKIEHQIGSLVDEAAASLDRHSILVAGATKSLLQEIEIEDIAPNEWATDLRRLGWKQDGIDPITIRALNYDARITPYFSKLRSGQHSELGTLCESEPFRGRTGFKRFDAEEGQSVRLVGQRQAFHVRPEGRLMSKSSVEGLGLMVPRGTTLIPSHGTLGEQELYCRAVYATARTSEYLFSGEFFRCVPLEGSIPAGFLFAFLRSNMAFRMLRSMSVGGKQQEQHAALIYRMPIPRLTAKKELAIAREVDEAADCFDHALDCEDEAWKLLEDALLDRV